MLLLLLHSWFNVCICDTVLLECTCLPSLNMERAAALCSSSLRKAQLRAVRFSYAAKLGDISAGRQLTLSSQAVPRLCTLCHPRLIVIIKLMWHDETSRACHVVQQTLSNESDCSPRETVPQPMLNNRDTTDTTDTLLAWSQIDRALHST